MATIGSSATIGVRTGPELEAVRDASGPVLRGLATGRRRPRGSGRGALGRATRTVPNVIAR